ncbi:unnamed protein product [Rodentolepis nana]|uniref:DDHD domain-containing protein n=1 Tax=Rodentolepis nana TaxID=102285 RepID=A0A0R3TK04_RODNA|nr:unnamed protein product [Rodentolepis nana]
MIIKEFRICMPMTVEEYRIAQLYMIQKKSREESTGDESGVEILKNEPYTDGPGGSGQYTFKIYHIGSHLPGWLRSIIPDTALRVEEEAWNAYPYTKTRYKVPFMEKFSLEIETMYLDDAGERENVFNLSSGDLNARIVDYIDIVTDPLAPSKPNEDPSTYVSQVTGRGPLPNNWRAEFQEAMRTGRKYPNQGTKPDSTGSVVDQPLPMRIMCSYKVCRVEFRYWGMQSKIESFIQEVALRRTMVNAHRQAWTWQDEWYGLTMKDIRRLEAETAKLLAMKVGRCEPDLVISPPPPSTDGNHVLQQDQQPQNQQQLSSQTECKDVKKQKIDGKEKGDEIAHSLNFGSCLSFASETERASMFQSFHGSDVDDEDFFDAQCIYFTKPGEVSQSNALLFVLHGGCLQEKATEESSRQADYSTFKFVLESIVSNVFPGLQSRVITQLVPCPYQTTEALRMLNMLDPSSLEPAISGVNKGAMRSIIPIGNIPILLTTSPHYPQEINQLAQLLNERYVEFRNSMDGIHFSGNVFVVADCVSSIMVYDLLVLSNPSFKRSDTFTDMVNIHKQEVQDGPSLLFDVQDVFFLGSPLGLLLALRRQLGLNSPYLGEDFTINSQLAPARPNCEQIFNIFSLADPFAYRLEPLLDPSFEHIPVVRLPTNSAAGRSLDQWQRLRERLPMEAFFRANVNSSVTALSASHNFDPRDSSSQRQSSNLPNPSFSVGAEDQASGQCTWWGQSRIDVGLHCPEAVQNILSRALPPLVHSSYWESKDASFFILWQLAERLHGKTVIHPYPPVEPTDGVCLADDGLCDGRIQTNDDEPTSLFRTCNSSPSMNANGVSGLSRQFRNSISNRLRFKTKVTEKAKANNPNHRGNDAIVLEGQPQIITARFTFGPLDLSSMANEEASLDPKVRAGSVDIMRHWHALGYLLIYISARPDMQHRQVVAWLAQHNFPPGLTFFLDGIFTDPLRQKALLLKSLIEQVRRRRRHNLALTCFHYFFVAVAFFFSIAIPFCFKFSGASTRIFIEDRSDRKNKLCVHCAYGSAKDVPIYRSLGLKAHQIFAVGKLSRRQTTEATPIREGYASHFKELMDRQHLSVPATGPLSAAVLRDAAEFFTSAPAPVQPAVFFDLPENICGSDLMGTSSSSSPPVRRCLSQLKFNNIYKAVVDVMADPDSLESDAYEFIKKAKHYEEIKDYNLSVFYYVEGAQAFLNARNAGSTNPDILTHAKYYTKHAESLAKKKDESKSDSDPPLKNWEFERAKCLLDEGLQEDERENYVDALALYTESVEILLKVCNGATDQAFREKVEKLAAQALDRAEELKKITSKSKIPTVRSSSLPHPKGPPGSRGNYTTEELNVLRKTSKINGREYLPFLDAIDSRERFAFPRPFTDSQGLLALSSKQQSSFVKWVRPSEFQNDPTMIVAVSCFPIRQTCVTDCSFVASMAVAAQYERQFKKRLITNIIYPQKRNGEPVYNPCGKYMVKLHLNGVPRKIIIDDFLPMGHHDELLCSFSTNKNELWVSLLEKAYMKVMGGYDFPGSNSNIDLHALTGWIPERVSIKSGSNDFDPDKEFRRLEKRFHQGHCLVTVATGMLTPDVEERSGLVPTHAYALLDLRQVNNTRLFLLKNPWSRTRWKGNFSSEDTKHWTPEMQKALNYDLNSAQYVDNGVFWIDYKSFLYFFDVFYINWNPELFPYTTCIHSEWSASEGPKKDVYSFANNPQYTLEVQAKSQAPVWVLLTRHITNKNDFAHNNEFIGLVVYKDIPGRKVYHPNDPVPMKDSVRINSPHCLIQLVQEAGTVTYTLVVSQYEKNVTIQYTLRAYSTAPMRFSPIVDPYTVTKTATGEWKGDTAAGCQNYPNFDKNPTFEVEWPNNEPDNQVLVEVRGPREFAIGFTLDAVNLTNLAPLNPARSFSTGNYRRGYTMLEMSGLSGGKYKLTIATFEPKQEGPFIISVKSTRPLKLTRRR